MAIAQVLDALITKRSRRERNSNSQCNGRSAQMEARQEVLNILFYGARAGTHLSTPRAQYTLQK